MGSISDHVHLGVYVKELKKHLPREVFKPVPSRLWWLLPHLLVVAFGIYAISTTQWNWAIKLAISVPIGASFASLGILGHEVLHGSVIRTPWLRNVIGFLCFMPFNIGPRIWRKWHNVEHHGHTQHEHLDPDHSITFQEYEHAGVRRILFWFNPFFQSVITFAFFSIWFTLTGISMLIRFFPTFTPKGRISVIAQFLLSVGLWVGLAVLIGPIEFIFAGLVPMMIANFIVMSYIATNHVLSPLTSVNDPLSNSLSVRTLKWLDILYLNFSHHTEHHLFPSMSPKYAPQVKALCKQLWPDRYHEMSHRKALLCVWRTPRLYAHETGLTDPVRGGDYPVLGHGLDPETLPPRGKRATN